ncbi:hypothetical protein MLD38_029003 [Melastoma candidum]|uniref:Uncharacterized protein n=1 Tax=Melastoma candidum TaxID=119954 RepID=A0ACB9N4A8_9MYRT|nr:hypothetical protein MLD38_029003 [Melastoma candidum]
MEELDVLATDSMESLNTLIILFVLWALMLLMLLPWGAHSDICEYLCISTPATTRARPDESLRHSAAKEKAAPLVSGVDPVSKEDSPKRADAGDTDWEGSTKHGTGEMADRGHGFKDGDHGWELVERSHLVRDFERAVRFIDGQTAAGTAELSGDEKSRFEGLINIVVGCLGKEPQPTSAGAKRNVGHGLTSAEVLMLQYVYLVQAKFPRWREDVERDLQEQFFRTLRARRLAQ